MTVASRTSRAPWYDQHAFGAQESFGSAGLRPAGMLAGGGDDGGDGGEQAKSQEYVRCPLQRPMRVAPRRVTLVTFSTQSSLLLTHRLFGIEKLKVGTSQTSLGFVSTVIAGTRAQLAPSARHSAAMRPEQLLTGEPHLASSSRRASRLVGVVVAHAEEKTTLVLPTALRDFVATQAAVP